MQSTLFTEPASTNAHVQMPEILRRVSRAGAIAAAAPIFAAIRPVCSQIVIAGSVRRGSTLVHDIEYVAVETREGIIRETLFTYCFEHKIVPAAFFGNNKNGKKQIKCQLQAEDKDLQLELYITQPKQFGWTHYVRTGPLEWNIATMQQLKRTGYTMQDNLIHNGNTIIDCSEESTIFKLLGIPPVEPKLRTGDKALFHALHDAGQKPKFHCK